MVVEAKGYHEAVPTKAGPHEGAYPHDHETGEFEIRTWAKGPYSLPCAPSVWPVVQKALEGQDQKLKTIPH